MEPSKDTPPPEETLSTPGVLDKYQVAGRVAQTVLDKIIVKCVADADIGTICAYGESEINAECAKHYTTKKGMEKGLAFPICLSANELCGHYSPLKSEPQKLKDGDVLKIFLGVHIDGFIAMIGHTIVVGAKSVEGKKADVILAAAKALEAAIKSLKVGVLNTKVTETIEKVVTSYNCNPVEGVLSHEVKKFLIDGNNVIMNKETVDQKASDHELEANEIYVLDVLVSTGEGKPKEGELRTTVYKRSLDTTYMLKSKSSRTFFTELNKKYPALGFSLASFENEIEAKIGCREMVEHDLLHSYPVLLEKEGEIVSHFCATVAVTAKRNIILSLKLPEYSAYKSEHKIVDEALAKLLEEPLELKKKKDAPTKTA